MSGARRFISLDPGEAWNRMRSVSIGRLAVCGDGQPEIFPVNFLATDRGILIRAEAGTKVDRILANPLVAFETDNLTKDGAWSVVVKGSASVLDDPAEIADAEKAPLWAFAPGRKDIFMLIVAAEVTGRTFTRQA